MPETKIDVGNKINILERKMRLLKRSIGGIGDVRPQDVEDEGIKGFEASFNAAQKDWVEFCAVWDQIDSLYVGIGEGDKFPSKEWLGIYDNIRREIVKANGTLLILQERSSSKVSKMNESSHHSSFSPELDKIPIPSFSGDLLKWVHFRDTFQSLIHNRINLSKVEKFHYLLTALKGEAAVLVSMFPVAEDSYDQAWSKVVKTYDNPRVLARLLIHRIVDCEVPSHRMEHQRYEAFLTGVADSIEAFNRLKIEDPCDFVLSTLALRVLDPETRKQFELSRGNSKDLPRTMDVINFVRQRKLALKMSQDIQGVPSRSGGSSNSRQNRQNKNFPLQKSVSFHAAGSPRRYQGSNRTNDMQCSLCKGPHHLGRCEKLKNVPSEERYALLMNWRVCFNCLSKGHQVKECQSKFRCRHCGGKHHTTIHREANKEKVDSISNKAEDMPEMRTEDKSFIGFGSADPIPHPSSVLLGTVSVLVEGIMGDYRSAHALVDSGSQHSFVTSTLARKIGAKILPSHISITGLAGSALPSNLVKGAANCTIRPNDGRKEFKITALVIDHITSQLPVVSLPVSITSQFTHLPLADHRFGEPKTLDILIGGDLFHKIITGASIPSEVEGLSLIPTSFGLVVAGVLRDCPSVSHPSFFIEENALLEDQMKSFWEIEEPRPIDRTKPEDAYCEEFFVQTVTQDETGRFTVRLPFKEGIPVGENKDIAYRRFYALETRFKKNPEFRLKYSQFMREYLDLGHMSPAKSESAYLIPHHGIWQEGPSGNLKLRVVFDASCTSSTGYSLNDALIAGPRLQEDLSNVLILFRSFAIPLCADMVKMYRQINIHEEDRKFQHILWRDNPCEKIQVMQLNTVTYGLKPSAFQALRVVRQLAQDNKSRFPLAARCILENSYVDDLCGGADNLEDAQRLRRELCSLLSSGGFTLSKWASNEPNLLLPSEEIVDQVAIQIDDVTKILGLLWNASSDSFSYSVKTPHSNLVTKRHILSSISRIFDPLGLLAPVIFSAKSLMQEVWRAKTDWDEQLPSCLEESWKELIADWELLSTIFVPRHITQPNATNRLVGFCDASLKGYGAAAYLHSESLDGKIKVSLIKAKTKVAPLKFTTIPRLELCAAVLLSKLISSLPHSLAFHVTCFSDSQVVLSWLHTPVHDLKVFEANRVSQILDVVPAHRWHHVSSEDNPADLASRGCSPKILKDSKLWWSGPFWLRAPASDWSDVKPDFPGTSLHSASSQRDEIQDETILSRFSSFPVMIRTIARIIRLVRRDPASTKVSSTISAEEFEEAELRCIMLIQRSHFPRQLYKNLCDK